MRVISVVGARPQFVKLAAIDRILRNSAHEHLIVHTGQHYDELMSDVFFADLGIARPTSQLSVGSGSHGVQTGAMLAQLDGVLPELDPTWVLVYGDTNTTIAAALSAVKSHFPVAHLEAGLRSFNRRMPEEHNRILTDHCADLLLAPTTLAARHLAAEGLSSRTVVVGDVMADVLFATRNAVVVDPPPLPSELNLDVPFLLATIHRAENTDDDDRLRTIVQALASLRFPVFLLSHPRLIARASSLDLSLNVGSLRAIKPLAYPAMVSAMLRSRGVITDSGGLQKEAFLLQVPCTTVRSETEWEETLSGGWNVLCNDLSELESIAGRRRPNAQQDTPYGDGNAAKRVVQALEEGVVKSE